MQQYTDNYAALSIKLIGLTDAEIGKFSAILDLAAFALKRAWQVTDKPTADFYLLKDVPNTQFMTERSQNRCFYYAPLNHPEKDNTVFHDNAHVPLLHHLVVLLNAAATKTLPEDPAQREQPAQKIQVSYAPSAFLRQLIEADTPLVIYLRDSSDILYIHPGQHVFYYPYPIERLDSYLFPDTFPSARDIPVDELNESVRHAGLQAQPLRHLIWYIAFTGSDGHLITGLSGHDVIHLTEWPYLGADSRHYIKLATYLKHHTVSLAEAIKVSGVDHHLANNFYNASQLAGLIKLHAQAAAQPHATLTDKLSFLDKIKKRLRH